MEPHINCDVMLLDSAYAVWKSTYETFTSETNVQRIYVVCEEVLLSKQGTRCLAEYYSFVKARWEELNVHHPYPTDIEVWKKRREELKVVSFFSGLTSHYASPGD